LDVWELDPDEPDWLESICVLLLEVGVPPTALSKAFQVDVVAIKELQAQLNIAKYGTAEISEAMNYLLWRAYEDGLNILESAPSASRQRFIITLLSRQSTILGKQSPEELERMRNQLSDLFSAIGAKPDPETGSIYTASPFTPTDGTPDDSEEGPES
jgi:hypothetical protein